jgi:hypothetical protein
MANSIVCQPFPSVNSARDLFRVELGAPLKAFLRLPGVVAPGFCPLFMLPATPGFPRNHAVASLPFSRRTYVPFRKSMPRESFTIRVFFVDCDKERHGRIVMDAPLS